LCLSRRNERCMYGKLSLTPMRDSDIAATNSSLLEISKHSPALEFKTLFRIWHTAYYLRNGRQYIWLSRSPLRTIQFFLCFSVAYIACDRPAFEMRSITVAKTFCELDGTPAITFSLLLTNRSTIHHGVLRDPRDHPLPILRRPPTPTLSKYSRHAVALQNPMRQLQSPPRRRKPG